MLIALLSLSGCATHKELLSDGAPNNAGRSAEEQEVESSGDELVGTEEEFAEAASSQNRSEAEGINRTNAVVDVAVGDRVFEMRLYDNKTANAFVKLLPLKITMDDLHANEKFFYLQEELPTSILPIEKVRPGDLNLFSENCLVLFYDSFATTYSYSPIGAVDDPSGFAEAVGSGSVEVLFRAVM